MKFATTEYKLATATMKVATATLKRQPASTILQPATLKLATATLKRLPARLKFTAENTKFKPATLKLATKSLILTQSKNIIETKKSERTTAVWRNWGFRQTLKLVLYLEVRSLIYTFGLPNPQLTPSHETLVATLTQKSQ